MKKIALVIFASATLLLAESATNTPPTAPQQDTNMQQGMQAGMGQGRGMGEGRGKGQGRGMGKPMGQNNMNSPFLIKQGLPHMTKLIMRHIDDKSFGLTPDQKEQLAKVRTATIDSIQEITPQVIALRDEIVKASTSGTPAAELKEKVEKLAALEASATMTHLKCIEDTKAILTKDQLLYLLVNKNQR